MHGASTDNAILRTFAMIRLVDDARRNQTAELLPHGVTVDEFEVLRVLDVRGDRLSPDQIVDAVHLPAPVVHTAIGTLISSGLVSQDSIEAQEGGLRVQTTEAGRAIYVQSLGMIRPQMLKLREAFTPEEFRDGLAFLEALHTWFKERDWS